MFIVLIKIKQLGLTWGSCHDNNIYSIKSIHLKTGRDSSNAWSGTDLSKPDSPADITQCGKSNVVGATVTVLFVNKINISNICKIKFVWMAQCTICVNRKKKYDKTLARRNASPVKSAVYVTFALSFIATSSYLLISSNESGTNSRHIFCAYTHRSCSRPRA